MQVAINYLLGNLGNEYSNTVGVVDLGGGSVQMAYAISKTVATESPTTTDGEYSYVKQLSLQGSKYYLYVYRFSYLLLWSIDVITSKTLLCCVCPCVCVKGVKWTTIEFGGCSSSCEAGSTSEKKKIQILISSYLSFHFSQQLSLSILSLSDSPRILIVFPFLFECCQWKEEY